MKLKQGVTITGIRPELLLGLMVADTVYTNNGAELVVTSVVDGLHSATSIHYNGGAADLRTRNLKDPQKVRDELDDSLTSDFDVVLEGNHIHMEFQPRRPHQ